MALLLGQQHGLLIAPSRAMQPCLQDKCGVLYLPFGSSPRSISISIFLYQQYLPLLIASLSKKNESIYGEFGKERFVGDDICMVGVARPLLMDVTSLWRQARLLSPCTELISTRPT